jgi:DNA-binding MarR family transcriptional regulator
MVATPRRDGATAALMALRRIVRYFRLADRDVESVCGISVAQLFVLCQLEDESPLSVADLAQRTLTDASSVSTVVARLVERGFVTRTPSRSDRRRVELSITPRGRKLVLAAPRVPQAALIDSIRELPSHRRVELVRSLELLAGMLGANSVEPRMFFEDEPPSPRVRRN